MNEVEVVFLIADLAGYTALTEAMGAGQAVKVVTRYVELANEVLTPGTRIVERVGDELLIVSDDTRAALRTALSLREAVESEPLFPSVRIGIHAGRVLEHQGRYFGPALNLTARVAAYARAQQILCTEHVARSVAGLDGVECHPMGAVRFKNVAEPVSVHEVVVRARPTEPAHIDPVCRMHVRPETAPARLPFAGGVYYFCSFECARRFAERPEDHSST